jgi:sulfate adenylyltransferase subunit 2
MRFREREEARVADVRFRTLGCWPVTGAIASGAKGLKAVLREIFDASTSERQGRINDGEEGGSLEQKKAGGYF